MVNQNNSSNIDVIFETFTKGIFFNPHKEDGLEFIPKNESNIRFKLKPVDPNEDASGLSRGLLCQLITNYSVTNEQFEFIDAYNNSSKMLRLAEGYSLPFKYNEKTLIDENGIFAKGYHPKRYLCPHDICELIQNIEKELIIKSDHFLKILRWRQGFDGPANIIETQNLYWKTGDSGYPLAPSSGGPGTIYRSSTPQGIQWNDEDDNDLQELYSIDNASEPLSHTLLREGISLSDESPKSAILIIFAALETAVKMHISFMAPDTSWLLEKTPSPPIFKLLRDYIPLIHESRGETIAYWDKVKPSFKNVSKLVELRNKVAHTGQIPDGFESVQTYIVLVSDMLYMLDVLAGHQWAKSHISHELRKSLGWPALKYIRLSTTISEPY